MKTDWKWEPELHRVTGIDDGGCRVVIAQIFGNTPEEIQEHGKLIAETERLREALEGMCYQFAGWNDRKGGLTTDYLFALEDAFDVLGWDDPHPAPRLCCDEPGCKERSTCGTPTPHGYRRTCC
jgi:hypothetical protein